MRGACHAFCEQAEFERLFRHNLFQVTGFTTQVFDLVRRGSTGCVASQPLLSRLREAPLRRMPQSPAGQRVEHL